jgi:hypothetical protein
MTSRACMMTNLRSQESGVRSQEPVATSREPVPALPLIYWQLLTDSSYLIPDS